MTQRIIGYTLLVLAIGIALFVAYYNSSMRQIPLVFSNTQMLEALWESYKDEYLEPGTHRTVDKQRDFVTTSEGQSYTMLRAVWMGDKATFDATWQWTKDNLMRDDDALFSWLFGQRADGTWGILHEAGGGTSATDADTDIALALIFAYARWQDDRYLNDARATLRDVWEYSVVEINGRPYLAANDQEKFLDKDEIIMNPSYLSPYAYRIFAMVDERPWLQLVETSYDVLERSVSAPLDMQDGGLPPDWIVMDTETGEIRPVADESLTTRYSYDALRTPWRVALDWVWFQEPRARAVLAQMEPLGTTWDEQRAVYVSYAHDGTVLEAREAPAMYGGAIGYFLVTDPAAAATVYEQKLRYLYDPDQNDWRATLSYYDDNWAWFGIALYTDLLDNLARNMTLPTSLTTN